LEEEWQRSWRKDSEEVSAAVVVMVVMVMVKELREEEDSLYLVLEHYWMEEARWRSGRL